MQTIAIRVTATVLFHRKYNMILPIFNIITNPSPHTDILYKAYKQLVNAKPLKNLSVAMRVLVYLPVWPPWVYVNIHYSCIRRWSPSSLLRHTPSSSRCILRHINSLLVCCPSWMGTVSQHNNSSLFPGSFSHSFYNITVPVIPLNTTTYCSLTFLHLVHRIWKSAPVSLLAS